MQPYQRLNVYTYVNIVYICIKFAYLYVNVVHVYSSSCLKHFLFTFSWCVFGQTEPDLTQAVLRDVCHLCHPLDHTFAEEQGGEAWARG